MPDCIGVVAEFNPFHNGHAAFISHLKKMYPDRPVVVVMSGNFVQRGDFAVQEKYSRAAAAVMGGADLVLELVFPYCALSAPSFAEAAMRILSSIGVCDAIAFGSEIASKEELLSCADRLCDPLFLEKLADFQKEHREKGYPTARAELYESLWGKTKILSSSNASLGVEYLCAAKRIGFSPEWIVIPRQGEPIRSEKIAAATPSATAIRAALFRGEEVSHAVPEYVLSQWEKEQREGRFPVNKEALYPVLRYLVTAKSRRELKQCYGFGALADRAVNAADACPSWEELVRRMGSAGFTDSRIRRALLSVLLEIERYAERKAPCYTIVLAGNETGRRVLGEMKESSSLSVFTKPAHALRSGDPNILRAASAAYRADSIYQLAFPKPHENAYFIKQSPLFLSGK